MSEKWAEPKSEQEHVDLTAYHKNGKDNHALDMGYDNKRAEVVIGNEPPPKSSAAEEATNNSDENGKKKKQPMVGLKQLVSTNT